ncbi:metal-dependent hydrolase [Olsenella uli]|uniref:metal-dependent hydrolase n=1 Tax=Olsenella uli TaxID=133926 RepID=UPI00325FCBBF
MVGRTHIAAGVAASLALVPLSGGPVACLPAVIGGALGGLACDTDVGSSEGSRQLRRAWVALAAIVAASLVVDRALDAGVCAYALRHLGMEQLAGMALLVAVLACGRASGHRGFSHSLLGLVVAVAAVRLAYPPLVTYFAMGYVSHVLLDLLNKRPVRLFWPVGRGVSLGACKTGGVLDNVLCALGVLVAVGLIAWHAGVRLPMGLPLPPSLPFTLPFPMP